jgi:hypothetical protein
MPKSNLVSGLTIAQYRAMERLGEDAMSVVYKAEDNRPNKPVTLDFPSKEMAQNHLESEPVSGMFRVPAGVNGVLSPGRQEQR